MFKPKEGTGNSRPSTPPASATSMSASSSTAELITHMASATMNDAINNVTVPPTSKGNQTFIQLLSNSLVSAKDASACASALPPTTINLSSAVTNHDADTLTAPNKTIPKKRTPMQRRRHTVEQLQRVFALLIGLPPMQVAQMQHLRVIVIGESSTRMGKRNIKISLRSYERQKLALLCRLVSVTAR